MTTVSDLDVRVIPNGVGWLYQGHANGHTATLVSNVPNEQVLTHPLCDEWRMGVELLDGDGRVLASDWHVTHRW